MIRLYLLLSGFLVALSSAEAIDFNRDGSCGWDMADSEQVALQLGVGDATRATPVWRQRLMRLFDKQLAHEESSWHVPARLFGHEDEYDRFQRSWETASRYAPSNAYLQLIFEIATVIDEYHGKRMADLFVVSTLTREPMHFAPLNPLLPLAHSLTPGLQSVHNFAGMSAPLTAIPRLTRVDRVEAVFQEAQLEWLSQIEEQLLFERADYYPVSYLTLVLPKDELPRYAKRLRITGMRDLADARGFEITGEVPGGICRAVDDDVNVGTTLQARIEQLDPPRRGEASLMLRIDHLALSGPYLDRSKFLYFVHANGRRVGAGLRIGGKAKTYILALVAAFRELTDAPAVGP